MRKLLMAVLVTAQFSTTVVCYAHLSSYGQAYMYEILCFNCKDSTYIVALLVLNLLTSFKQLVGYGFTISR